jgi:hypothetical protein
MRDQVWADLYRDYLKSQEWAVRRAKVMRRAGHICEGCGNKPATEVHHLTYDHVTEEFLFELVAVCGDCHERLHRRLGEPKRPLQPTWTRHRGLPAPKETEYGRENRLRLEKLAEEARRKFMGEEEPHDGIPEAMEMET